MRHLHAEVTVAVGEEWQLDRLTDYERYQSRGDNLCIITAAELFLLFVQILFIDDKDVFTLHLRQYRTIGLGKMLLQDGYLVVELIEERLGCIIAGKQSVCAFTGTA